MIATTCPTLAAAWIRGTPNERQLRAAAAVAWFVPFRTIAVHPNYRRATA